MKMIVFLLKIYTCEPHRSNSKHNQTNNLNPDLNTQQNLSLNIYKIFSLNNRQNFCFSHYFLQMLFGTENP